VRAYDVVGRLDQLVQLARQLRLDRAAQRRQREADAVGSAAGAGRAGAAAGLSGADGKITMPDVVQYMCGLSHIRGIPGRWGVIWSGKDDS